MPSWLPSFPYPAPDQPGFWQPVTSTLQWCEEDYYATYYSAEIMNTLSNLMFFYCAWKGIRSCRKNGHDFVFQVGYFGYFIVGVGSFMFHTSLKYPWQLVDELNMIYTTCLMCFASLTHGRSTKFQVWLGIACTVFCGSVTAYYHYLQDPVFHQNLFGIMTLWLVIRSAWKMETALRPRWRGTREEDRLAKEKKGLDVPTAEEQEAINCRDLKLLKNLWIMVVWGVSVFLTGFALWGIDNVFCSTLRTWRRNVGLPWGLFLELHAWWHILTGWGSYSYLVWGAGLRFVLEGKQDEYDLKWPRLWLLPEFIKKTSTEKPVNGTVAIDLTNGHARKQWRKA